MKTMKMKKPLENDASRDDENRCRCANNSSYSSLYYSHSIDESSYSISSYESSDTSDWSSESDGELNDNTVQWECTCQIRKRGGKKKAEARAIGAKIHNHSKKKLHKRSLSPSSDYSLEYETSDEYIPKKRL